MDSGASVGEGPLEVLGRPLGEGPLQQVGVPHERGADPDGGRQPLVGVDDGRVGPGQRRRTAGPARAGRRRAGRRPRRRGATRPVAVGEVGQLVEGIDGAGVGRARRAHDGHGHEAGLLVGGDGPGDGVDVDPLVVIDRDGVDAVAAEAEHGRRAGDGVVGLDRGVDPARPVDPVGRGVDAPGLVGRLAGRAEADQVGHRTAGREQALVARPAPPAATAATAGPSPRGGPGRSAGSDGGRRGGRQAGQHAGGRRSVLDPAGEAGLADPGPVGDDEPDSARRGPGPARRRSRASAGRGPAARRPVRRPPHRAPPSAKPAPARAAAG